LLPYSAARVSEARPRRRKAHIHQLLRYTDAAGYRRAEVRYGEEAGPVCQGVRLPGQAAATPSENRI
jgi:hypothetical protein